MHLGSQKYDFGKKLTNKTDSIDRSIDIIWEFHPFLSTHTPGGEVQESHGEGTTSAGKVQ